MTGLAPILGKLVAGNDLTRREAAAAMNIIMDGAAADAQIAAFAVALRMKGESADEIAGCAQALRRRAEKIGKIGRIASRLVDTCGTGGDLLGTINVSTLSAIVAAGAGLPVAKHGNRSVSSRCGSADLLEALGVPIDLTPAESGACLDSTGLTFLFAPRFHPALRHAAPARRALGLRTIFNLLGPLCNPAGARRQVMGIFDGRRLRPMAEVLRTLGTRRAMLVHGHDGMDELTVTGPTLVVELNEGRIRGTTVTPEDAGLRRWKLAALRGGAPEENAARALAVLEGGRGAARDITLLNAAAALVVGGAASTLREGAALAAETIDSGRARAKFEDVRSFCLGVGGKAERVPGGSTL
ncbi:MAG TPA: anthranilate phosphoribosyltransferase [Candidatus Polarisedimenticolia bacterium]|jgi:anthranilate phosphoribosyltransferase